MKHYNRRNLWDWGAIGFVLAVVLVFGMFPLGVFAQDMDGADAELPAADAGLFTEEATGDVGLPLETMSLAAAEEAADGGLIVQEAADGGLIAQEAADGGLIVQEAADGGLVVQEAHVELLCEGGLPEDIEPIPLIMPTDAPEGLDDPSSLAPLAEELSLEETLRAGIEAELPEIDISQYGVFPPELMKIYLSLLNLNPDYFYVTGSYSYSWSPSRDRVVSLYPVYHYTGAERVKRTAEFNANTETILAAIPSGVSPLEQALAVNDYFCNSFKYSPDENMNYMVDVLLSDKHGVCQAFALGYQHIMNQLGIPCRFVVSISMGHAWNMVQIDGDWYHVDTTWNNSRTYGLAFHGNFLLSDVAIASEHYGWDAEPKATNTKYDAYFWRGINNAFARFGGAWYFIRFDKSLKENNTQLCKWDGATNEASVVYQYDDKWLTSIYYWSDSFAGVAARGKTLLFSKPKGIYSIDPSAANPTPTLVFEDPANLAGLVSIYSFFAMDGRYFYCEAKSSAGVPRTVKELDLGFLGDAVGFSHTLNVAKGTGGGNYAVGAVVSVTANTAPSGMRFKQWDTTTPVVFRDGTRATSAVAKFNMPDCDVSATAVFEPIPAAKEQLSYSLAARTYSGKAQGVSVAPKAGVGTVTAVYYSGTGGTDYAKTKSKPANAGSYAVTADVAAGTDYGAANGIPLGTFTIDRADLSQISVAIAKKAWTGKQIKPSNFSFSYNGIAFPASANAAMKYGTNKNIGKGTVKLTGNGTNFTGSKSVTFKIVPKKNAVSKITAGTQKMKVKWSKVSADQKVTKYQVRYRAKGAAAWKTKSYSATASSATIKSLKKGKKYEVQVRSYKTVSGVKYYSAWSVAKTSGKIK